MEYDILLNNKYNGVKVTNITQKNYQNKICEKYVRIISTTKILK